jgi:hypothetical protein
LEAASSRLSRPQIASAIVISRARAEASPEGNDWLVAALVEGMGRLDVVPPDVVLVDAVLPDPPPHPAAASVAAISTNAGSRLRMVWHCPSATHLRVKGRGRSVSDSVTAPTVRSRSFASTPVATLIAWNTASIGPSPVNEPCAEAPSGSVTATRACGGTRTDRCIRDTFRQRLTAPLRDCQTRTRQHRERSST